MIKKILFLIFISLLFVNPLYPDIDYKDPTWNTGKDDLRHLKGKNSNYKKGLDSLKQAIKLEKKGKIEKANKRFNRSLKFFISANEENPDQTSILYFLGYIYERVDDYIMAEIYFTEGLEINSKHSILNKNLGELYIKTNRVTKAKERLKFLKDCKCDEYKDLENSIKLGVIK
jgi:tetratricopeptide (TPR) repeat protein